MKALLDAIVLKINSVYPEKTKYLIDLGEGFERPSFFIYLISSKQDHINKRYYQQNIIVQIVYFDSLDKYKNTNKLRQLEVGQKLMELFSDISLRTDNGYVDIQDVFTDFTVDNDIFVQLTLDKYKTRAEEVTTTDKMEEISLEI